MLNKLIDLCKNNLVNTILESHSLNISIPSFTSILNAGHSPHNRMDKWIKILQTPFPLGLNDNIYHEGNISKMPNFDVLTLLESR